MKKKMTEKEFYAIKKMILGNPGYTSIDIARIIGRSHPIVCLINRCDKYDDYIEHNSRHKRYNDSRPKTPKLPYQGRCQSDNPDELLLSRLKQCLNEAQETLDYLIDREIG